MQGSLGDSRRRPRSSLPTKGRGGAALSGWWGWRRAWLATAVASLFLATMGTNPISAQNASEEGRLRFEGGQSGTAAVTTAANTPAGFSITPVITGLTLPTVVRFSPDGRVLVAEKFGRLKVFSSLTDTTPDLAVDVSADVYDWWDRGLLGMALHPDFPATPYAYLLYTWDIAGYSDACPANPGPTIDGCMANGRLVRVSINTSNQQVGSPVVMLEGNWCQQYPSHSVGSVDFGPEGALYVSVGDGASFNVVDYGQLGGTISGSLTPMNPCGDPTAEGGALRSQDLRTAGDLATFDGTILRIDPITGAAWPGNPLLGGDPSDDRIIAYGLRNPFRTMVADDGQIWIGDVGWGTWEEINRIPSPTGAVRNFGWPCNEGNARQPNYDAANLSICENLYTSGGTTAPHFAYQHGVALRACPETPGSTSAITGLTFYEGGSYPASYDGALFFTDYSRQCIWVMYRGAANLPDPANIDRFATSESSVGLYLGPAGDVFSVDHVNGSVKRISYSATNQLPVALAQASPTSGTAPLVVNFTGSGSSDPDGDPLTYAWDLDADGQLDDAFTANPTYTYTTAGSYTVTLRVDDGRGGVDTDSVTIVVSSSDNTPPRASIGQPTPALHWKVGEVISFSGSGTDDEDVPSSIPAARMSWSLVLYHCAPNIPTDCHAHPLNTWNGIASGSFVGPGHEAPAYVELTLTVTDTGGLTDTEKVRLDPATVQVSFVTIPNGLQLSVGSTTQAAPFSREMIVDFQTTIGAPTPQTLGGATYDWVSWSQGGPVSQGITAVAPRTYTATFNGRPVAVLTASPTTGRVPLTVSFNATGSTDPEGGSLNYAWDLDGDGVFGSPSNTPTASFTYSSSGTYFAKVRVSDPLGSVSVAEVKITIKRGRGR